MGIAGVMAGGAVDSESSDDTVRTKKLDAEIGVTDGNIGAPNLEHPPGRERG